MAWDYEMALERMSWAYGAGLIGLRSGGPVGAVVGIGIGGVIPDLLDWYEGDPAPAPSVAMTQEAVSTAWLVIDEVAPEQRLTPEEIEVAKGQAQEIIWGYSYRLADEAGDQFGGAGTSFKEAFATAAAKISQAGSDYYDFFAGLFARASKEIDADRAEAAAAAAGVDTSGGLWPRKPKPKPTLPAPVKPTPLVKPVPWGLYVVGISLLALVAAVVIKNSKK